MLKCILADPDPAIQQDPIDQLSFVDLAPTSSLAAAQTNDLLAANQTNIYQNDDSSYSDGSYV